MPAGDVPPAGILCATTQIAQKSSRERIVSFLADILKNLRVEFSADPFTARVNSLVYSGIQL